MVLASHPHLFLVYIFAFVHSIAFAQTSLDLSGAGGGSILLGNDTDTCDGTKQGALRFNTTSSCAEYCDGTDWICPGTSAVSVDTVPDTFDFTDQTNLIGSDLVESDIVQITGLDSSASLSFPTGVSSYNLAINYDISVAGDGSPEYRICSDGSCAGVVTAWTSTAGSIENNQYLQLRATTNATPLGTHTVNVTVSETTADWDLTTGNCSAPDTNYTTPGMYTYTVPGGCGSAIISVYGAGGAGGGTYGGGGGGSVVLRTSGSVLLAAAGGGGGGRQGGSGGGYAQSTVTVSNGESLTVYVGGGGQCGTYGDGGAYGGGTGSYGGGSSDSGLGYGGGAGSYENGGDSIYGGGGGSYQQGGSSTYGGAGGGYDNGGSTVNGASPVGNASSGGGGYGDSVILGGNASGVSGGSAANGGPGDGTDSGCSGSAGDGQVVINPNP